MSTACNISFDASTYEEHPMPPLFWVGVCVTLVGSTITPLGMNLQRLAQLRLAKRGLSNVCASPLWLAGLSIFIAGNACDAIALAMAPQSVITPLGCVSLISNLFIARLVLREVLTRRVVLGSLVVMLGVVAIVFPAAQTEECIELRESVETLLARWRKPAFLVFAALQLTLLGCVGTLVLRRERTMRTAAAASPEAAVGPLTRHLTAQELRTLKLTYPLLIGLVATYTAARLTQCTHTPLHSCTLFTDGVHTVRGAGGRCFLSNAPASSSLQRSARPATAACSVSPRPTLL
jgi:hypothetical protein